MSYETNHITIDGEGTTENGKRIAAKFNPALIETVAVTKTDGSTGGPANMTFYFKDGDAVTIINSFGIGYGGTGPWGVHDILINLGVPEEEAEMVFSHHSWEPLKFSINS